MNSIIAGKQNIVIVALSALIVLGLFFASASAAHADMGVDDSWYGADSYNDSWYGADTYNDSYYGADSYNDSYYGADSYNDSWYGADSYNDSWFGADSYNDSWYGADTYNDSYYGADSYNDSYYGADSYNDSWYGADSYNDSWYGADSYNDSYYAADSYNDSWYGADTYGDQEYLTETYKDTVYEETYYPNTVTESTSYPNVVTQTTTGATQTVYNPSTGVYETTSYAPSIYETTSYSPSIYESTSYAPSLMAMGGGYGGSYPYMASAGASMPFYQQQYQQSYQQQRYPNYPTPSFPQPSFPQSSHSNVNTTSNYCTGNSCNSSYIDNSFVNNSINNSFNTSHPSTISTVYPVTALPIVQYQFPHTYSYPIHQSGLYCTITANPTFIQNGQASYLSWSSNGTSAWLSDGIGYVSAHGSLAVRPDATRTYTLTIYGQGGSNVCSVTVSVGGSAPYVSLSQIPYTGFDLGPIGNAMYLMSLMAVAIGAAYFALYYKGGVLAIAGSLIKRPVARTAPVVGHAAYAAPAPIVHSTPASREIKDTMFITRSKDGVPRIVINRA